MKFDLLLWANSGDQIQDRTLQVHRTTRETTLLAFFVYGVIQCSQTRYTKKAKV